MNTSPRASLLAFCLITVMALAGTSPSARAGIWADPKPAFTWQELLDCELVVEAKYHGHDKNTLSLEVVRTFKGVGVAAGDVLQVSLEHLYTVETGPTGWDRVIDKKKQPDGIPKLCYKDQIMNPGDLVPLPILRDARQPGVYFFPKRNAPALQRRGQVHFQELATGWRQAVTGQPMNLSFRLAQDIDREVRQAALEELYVSRDRATLAQLFDWVLGTYPQPYFYYTAANMLSALGDRHGDVYDRAWKLLTAETLVVNTREHFEPRYALACIAARVDGARALKEFSEILDIPSLPVRPPSRVQQCVASALGEIGNEAALVRSVALLHNPELAQYAVSSLRTLLGSSVNSQGIDLPEAQAAKLRELAMPQLQTALQSVTIGDEVKNDLRHGLAHMLKSLEVVPPVDFAKAQEVLLRRGELNYPGKGDGEGSLLLKEIGRSKDPKFIPLLVKILRDVPGARGNEVYLYQETLVSYAKQWPDLMRRELIAQGLNVPMNADDGSTGYRVNRVLYVEAGLPLTVEHLQEMHSLHVLEAWLKNNTLSPELLAQLKARIQREPDDIPDTTYLAVLYAVSPQDARPVLDRALAIRQKFADYTRRRLLELALRTGQRKYARELEAMYLAELEEGLKKGDTAPALLLDLNNDASYRRYLSVLDATPKARRYQFFLTHGEFPNGAYSSLLARLLSHRPADYFTRLQALLASKLLVERQMGEQLLKSVVNADIDFEAEEFASIRSQQLQRLRPLLKRLAELPASERTAYIGRLLTTESRDIPLRKSFRYLFPEEEYYRQRFGS